MSGIQKTFARLREDRRKALVIFLPAGDPGLKATADLAVAAHEAGADIVEIGVPFSDPLADGPVIQESFQRAIKKGANLDKTLGVVRAIRKRSDVPLVFMLSANLVLRRGVEKFMKESASAGVDGLILPDVPVDEAEQFRPAARRSGLDYTILAAPTSTDRRLKKIAARSTGFVYYINVRGITGKQSAVPREAARGLSRLKKVSRLPVVAGFGVTGPEQARELAGKADGIVIGSQAIRVIREAKNTAAAVRGLERFVKSVRKGMNGP
ncbi:MAG: tryptophan synthase subunit alpha [Candidatus Nitrospinota bacterium M3_3B_026]